ncbi:MAG: hypothetical protein ACI89L_001622 [Phycisphaerales bacterium]|jgi:hypothetical protein
MRIETSICWLVGATAFAVVPTALAQDGTDYATVNINEDDVGPNVGSQPRSPRRTPTEETQGEAPEIVSEEDSRLYVGFGVEYTTAYYSRGFLYEDNGLILQPYLDLSLDVIRTEDSTISLTMGTWSSYQDEATEAGTTDSFREDWYESDLYIGASLSTGNWYLEVDYYWYTSPSDAWDTIEEIYFSAAYDDSDDLGAWSLQPTAILAIEVGENANDGYHKGTYLQLGVSPGFTLEEGTFESWEITFPVSVGLSLGNYYEGDSGENDFFGFASVGATASLPLDLDESWGSWYFYAGVQALFLGETASSWNDDDDTDAILTVGLSIEF